ncbi:MAG TPA: four-carbon acid sugar kinase family protein [Tepidisphaeraceae bacterium]|nr:four-carbon acid sugar kinase family protein [Tepidisphaeraceae bacterium]
MSNLLLSFYGDDFTGSTDAVEALARGGLRTILFARPPTPQQLAHYDGLRAFGVAGMTRSMPPDEMERTLRPALTALAASGAPIVHYKVCSTFDSSPTVGSIGKAIDVGAEVFAAPVVPVVVGAPALGRYCVFGNLFARAGTESEPYRLDRHSMSRHPTTPMNEADLRLHLARQTGRTIGLIDVVALANHPTDLSHAKADIVLIDLLSERDLPTVGRLLSTTRFVVGSSGVESALMAHWGSRPASFPEVASAGAVLAVCGSCSPVSVRQVDWAIDHGFLEVPFDIADAGREAARAIRNGRSVVIHTRHACPEPEALGALVHELIEATGVRRLLVAGGDTSGQIARALGIESLEMIGELTRGAPLCRATAPNAPADGIEVTFKGGQIGPVDFFGLVRDGSRHA